MNPWAIAGVIVGAGALLFAATAAAAEPECTFGEQVAFPHMGLAAIMLRECNLGDGRVVWMWDVAALEDVAIGPSFQPEQWPESLAFGQEPTKEEANDAAMNWVDQNLDFITGGGERSPFAERVEGFLARQSPQTLEDLREIFEFEGTAVSDAWPYVEALRVASTDEQFCQRARALTQKLSFLSEDEQAQLRNDLMSTLGFLDALELKTILDEAQQECD